MASSRRLLSLLSAGLTGFLLICPPAFSQPTTARFQEAYSLDSGEIYSVNLEIDAGDVVVLPAEGRELSVAISYTKDEFRVHSDFDKKRRRVELEFEKNDWVGDHDNVVGEVRIKLPTDARLEFSANVKAGEIDIDLGGLSLQSVDLKTWAGSVKVDFSEPNQVEMHDLEINTKVGETELTHLGNARFREASINGGIGEMHADFRGALLNDSRADVDLDIGETEIIVSESVGVSLRVSKFLFLTDFDPPRGFRKSGRYYYSSNYDEATKNLSMRVSPGLGHFQFEHHQNWSER